MFELISPIISLISTWFTGVQKVQQAKIDTQLAIEQNKSRLALDTESHNSAWEMSQLQNSDKWIRRSSFLLFSTPFVVAIVAPELVQSYFTVGLSAVPEWYIKTYIGITGAIWGISNLKNSVTQIASSIVSQKGSDK